MRDFDSYDLSPYDFDPLYSDPFGISQTEGSCPRCQRNGCFTISKHCENCGESMCDECWNEGKDEFVEMIGGGHNYGYEDIYRSRFCPECFFGEYKRFVEERKEAARMAEIRQERERREIEQWHAEYLKELEENERKR